MLSQIKPANATYNPQKIMAYGVQGIGKNTFAATFDRPILLQIEDGSAAIDIPAFPLVTTYQGVKDIINALHGAHNFKTLVVDTADWLEPLLWAAVCESKGWNCIEDPGFGRGYIEVDNWWRTILGGFDSLRYQKGMDIVILAHSEVKKIELPDSDPYDHYQPKMNKRATAILEEWCDIELFLNYKVQIHKTKVGINDERTRATGNGDRVICTTERPAYKAKSRWPLPDEILIGKDRTWAAFHTQLAAATGGKYISPIVAPITKTEAKEKTK